MFVGRLPQLGDHGVCREEEALLAESDELAASRFSSKNSSGKKSFGEQLNTLANSLIWFRLYFESFLGFSTSRIKLLERLEQKPNVA